MGREVFQTASHSRSHMGSRNPCDRWFTSPSSSHMYSLATFSPRPHKSFSRGLTIDLPHSFSLSEKKIMLFQSKDGSKYQIICLFPVCKCSISLNSVEFENKHLGDPKVISACMALPWGQYWKEMRKCGEKEECIHVFPTFMRACL